MKNLGLFSRCLMMCALLLVSSKVLATGASSPALWHVSKDGASIYLFGSIHFGKEDYYPLPTTVEAAYASAEVLVVEVDISSVSPAAAMMAVTKYAGLAPGQNLQDILGPDIYKKLESYAATNGIPVSAFGSFQPWFVGMQLLEMELKKAQLRADLGVDLHFLKRKNKVVHQLETMESQLAMLAGLSASDQALFLGQGLDDLQSASTFLSAMSDSWRSGDTAALSKLVIEPFKDDPNNKGLYDTLLLKRNVGMAEAAQRYLEKGQKAFIVVGAAHLIGSGSVVDLLSKAGYSVKRIQNAAPQAVPAKHVKN